MIAEQSLRPGLPRAIIAVHAAGHVQLRQPSAVKQPVVQCPARDRTATAKKSQAASFDLRLPTQSPAARICHKVEDAADRVRSVKRRPGAAQDLHPLQAHYVELV